VSYILDALRRADAERERGAVPGLQSQQNAIAEDDAESTRPRRLVWAVGALALALVAALTWAFLGGASPTSRLPVEGSVVPAPLPVLPSAQDPTAPAVGTATAPRPGRPPCRRARGPSCHRPRQRSRLESKRASCRRRRRCRPLDRRRPPPASSRRSRPRRSGRAIVGAIDGEARRAPQRGTDASASTTAGSAPNAGAARVYTPAELPEEIRRDLPKVVIGGSSYSGDAASRMIMVNGQVFHEGDRLAPGLVLERIRQKSAVLSFKGWQYEVMF
jgi:general secretion pathway protein B